MNQIPSNCPLCKGKIHKSTTIFSVELNTGVVIVRNVPAWVCTQCGEEWIEDSVAEQLEKITNRARMEKTQLEMVSMAS
ncbi:MAG: type II toxin-antitoxin system MqsA family antitoxin [Saprospiraceae bacterium]|nr:type II toxin-antitoxin system MqsA family antitoxin [Saprospiraceae bacterium]